ncbi:hypothetical protein HNV28_31085 [Myxococcus xanthus]|uniref:Uncharacterized protein n=1 Tax=Myxococcus xanthus TaxID=34 RepID=A0A7Y4INV5_MYXXA|nr:hypothetical protein [Myxococcus xanthus]NOJ86600.1 hypothetical protein [Myxococcus xanthus]
MSRIPVSATSTHPQTRTFLVKSNLPLLRGLMMVFMALLAGCGGCQSSSSSCSPSQYGTNGCACRTDSASCNAGLVCRSGTCEPCGNEGGACCVNAGTTSCSGTLTCVMEAAGERCRNCGEVGEACCVSSGNSQFCRANAVCVSGSCQSVAAHTCDPNGSVYTVGIQDMNLCARRVVEVRASSPANALQCAGASGMLAADESVYEIPDTPITDYELCLESQSQGRRTTSVQAFEDYNALRCARWTRCGASDPCTSVTHGACTP